MAGAKKNSTVPTPEALVAHIPYRLGQLTNLVRRATTDSYVRQSAVSGREWRVLAMIGITGPVQASEIVGYTGMDKATVARAVGRLVKLAMVEQSKDPEDGRVKLLQLTEDGERLCGRIIPQMKDGGDMLAGALTPDERRMFLRCLDKLSRRALEMLEDSEGR
ncbi:MarR family winged helix-turn-helix transcriptional regulator [Aestuariispira insulae]|uniref:DNA-binding MarR family transcriptional regulator n=1 Tax=Aestuariispira insulae TaxID=1461337 RepID=A0A3D9HFA2_9PROT|nr:MarR family winged helix-turn-helix transcriptional regulator [Aestuariispira insulae]RED48158.1 DNA-binding MarR family transcriptional regulator [Aestuariispira insulae]